MALFTRFGRAGLCVLLLAGGLVGGTDPVRGAWSADPSANLSVADGASDQILSKLAPTGDGGVYVSWFDGIGTGYDVRLQKLDSMGNEVLAHNGVLVADRAFSSVQDYGLDVDVSGNALLVFRDDSGANVQITASKVSAAGTLLWGAGGIQLTATTDFVASPKIAGTSDGGAVVAWTQDVTTRVQKLDAAGATVWMSDVVLTPGSGSFSASDLHGTGNDVILSYVHQTGGFGSPRHLYAQKYDAAGATLWGAGVAVFDGGSLQFGNFPSFVSDGSGGALFSWYDTSSSLQCYGQHVLADGTEAYGHNGAAASTNGVRVRVSPWISYDAANGTAYLFWQEQNSLQSQSGLYGQRFDATGTRLWTDEGSALLPLSATSITNIRTIAGNGSAFVFWDASPSFGADQLHGARIDDAGAFDIGPFDVASTPSSKSRLQAASSSAGHIVLSWSDDRVDGGDVLAQNVNLDGTLGPPSTSVGSSLPAAMGLTAYPVPALDSVEIRWVSESLGAAPHSPVHLDIVGVSGRLVASRVTTPDDLARGVVWNGQGDQGGARVGSGVYWARVRETKTEAVRLVWLD